MSGVVPARVARFGSAPRSHQQPHRRRIARERRAQQRRLPGEVHPRNVVERIEPFPWGRHLAGACVDVGALVEQKANQVQNRRAVDAVVFGDFLVVVVHVQVAVFDRRPERRPAPEVVGVDVRALLGEESGDVDLAIERGHQQRTNSVAITQFELGSGGDEHPCRLQPPVASGIQKRRHAAFHFGTPAAVRQTALIDADPFRSAARALARRHERRRRPLARLGVHRRRRP